MNSPKTSPSSAREWLEADGLGGFASGTAASLRTRRYHALLLVATTPPTGRLVLVNGLDAWVWVHKGTPAARHEARREYLQPLLDHLEEAGLGHVSEIADAEAPHIPRGCPWQAWSVGEALWLDRVVLAEPARSPRAVKPTFQPAPASALIPA